MKENIVIGYSIVSPLHLINFLTYLSANNIEKEKIFLFVSKYWKDYIIPKRYIEFCQKKNIFVIFDEVEKLEILHELFSKRDAYNLSFIFVKAPSLRVVCKCIFYRNLDSIILIDEGISSYAGFTHSLKASFREKGLYYGFKVTILMVLIFVLKLFLRKKISKFSCFEKDGITVNKLYKIEFLKVLKSLINQNESSDINNTRGFLFCTQPWVELNVMKKDQYQIFLSNIESDVNKKGYKLFIKKHPADVTFDYSEYNLINFDGIVEELILQSGFSGILSTSSTSSVLTNCCLGLKSYLLNFKDIKDYDKKLKKIYKTYCLDFSKI